MQNKHKISAFDIVAFLVFLTLAFIFWSFMRAITLVQPSNQFEFEASLPVHASAPKPVQPIEPGLSEIKGEFEAELDKIIENFTTSQPNELAIYVEHLSSGARAEHNGQLEMTMASLYKPFVAVETLKMADAGSLNLLDAALKDGTTLEVCIEKTITVSDNRCGLALLSMTNLNSDFGLKKLKTLGYEDTDLRSYFPSTTARDMARLMKDIYSGKNLKADSQGKILEVLLEQKINDRLPAGLPENVKFAHKTGDLNGYVHDAGFVLDGKGRDYVIVVMSAPDDSGRLLEQRYASFGRLANAIHEAIFKYSVRLGDLSS